MRRYRKPILWHLAYWAWIYHYVYPSKLSWKCHIAYTCEVTDRIQACSVYNMASISRAFANLIWIPSDMGKGLYPLWCVQYKTYLFTNFYIACVILSHIALGTWDTTHNWACWDTPPQPHPTGPLKNWTTAHSINLDMTIGTSKITDVSLRIK